MVQEIRKGKKIVSCHLFDRWVLDHLATNITAGKQKDVDLTTERIPLALLLTLFNMTDSSAGKDRISSLFDIYKQMDNKQGNTNSNISNSNDINSNSFSRTTKSNENDFINEDHQAEEKEDQIISISSLKRLLTDLQLTNQVKSLNTKILNTN